MRAALLIVFAAAVLGAVATAARAAAPSTPPETSFTGLDSSQLPGADPADVQIAAAPTSLVELVNSAAAVFPPAGGPARQTLTLGRLFSSAAVDRSNDDTTDPRVLYDPLTRRFFGAMFDITRTETVFGATATSDPTSPRTVAGFQSQGCPDQPRLGLSTTVVVLTDDLFSSCRGNGGFVGGEITVVSKQDLLNGIRPRASHFGPSAAFEAITPAASLAPSSTAYLVSVATTGAAIGIIRVSGPTPSSLPVQTIRLARPLRNPPAAPQRGTNVPVDTGDPRVQNAFVQNGILWLVLTDGCGTGGSRSCARVLAVDPAHPRVLLDRTLALPNGRFLFYPAIAPDSRGNLVVGFEYSSPAAFPSLAYAYMRPDGGFGAPADAVRGTAPNESGRYGDYSGAAVDPADPGRVWIAGEVGGAVGGTTLGWSTGIAAVRVPAQPPALLGDAATRRGTSAVITARVYPEAARTTSYVEFGRTSRYGSRTRARTAPATIRAVAATFAVPRLRRGATYHFRIVATSARGTVRSHDHVVRVPR